MATKFSSKKRKALFYLLLLVLLFAECSPQVSSVDKALLPEESAPASLVLSTPSQQEEIFPHELPAQTDSHIAMLVETLSGVQNGAFNPELLGDLELISGNIGSLLDSGDSNTLVSLVSEWGLVIAPYGVGTPEKGLQGEALKNTLEALMENAELQIFQKELSSDGKIGLMVGGFNPITVVPAIGDPLLMTDPAYVVWRLEDGAHWRLWLIAPDPFGMLPQSSNVLPGEERTDTMEEQTYAPDEYEVQLVVSEVLELFQGAEVEKIADRVRDQGLIITPYSVDAPEEGLTGVPLKKALETMLRGADPQVVALDIHAERKIGIAITGLNPAKITPAVGDELVISSPSLLTLDMEQNGDWELETIAVDSDLKLLDAIEDLPYEVWKQDPSIEALAPHVQAVIAAFADMLGRADPLEISLHIPQQGLRIAPYGVGAPERGLSGDPLLMTLEILLAGAQPEIVAVDLSTPGRIDLAIGGLNRVFIQPIGGEPTPMTDPAFASLRLGPEDSWGFWLLAPDTFDLLKEALENPPFEPWK